MSRAPAETDEKPTLKSRLASITKKIWWLHSFGALGFGIGVMIFARSGLAYADKLLMVLGASWLLLFVALRFIVGRQNRGEHENIAKKGVRIVVNYIIKNLYQQMFFFLVPMYASSAVFSLSSYNWWLPPLLLFFAVLSTMDLVFDNFIMERRVLASTMYGVALFGVLNLMLPLVLGIGHFPSLLIAAGLTAPAVALLSFSARSVLNAQGLLITLSVSTALVALAWFGRAAIPPAPLAMRDGAVGHGTLSSYECLPGKKRVMNHTQLDGLRCGSTLSSPGGLRDAIRHVWKLDGKVLGSLEPERLSECDGMVFRSEFPADKVPEDPAGKWSCVVQTKDGQLLGVMSFKVKGPKKAESAKPTTGAKDAGVGSGDAGVVDAGRPAAAKPADARPQPDAAPPPPPDAAPPAPSDAAPPPPPAGDTGDAGVGDAAPGSASSD